MSATGREPTADELTAMAYVDGELPVEERAAFELRLAAEPALAREVTALQRLAVLARHAAGPEPIDAEWSRLRQSPLHRAGQGLAWSLLGVAGVAAIGWLALELARSSFSWPLRVALGALLLGLVLLFLLTLRARLRTLPYDPYTEVRR
jgi:anti-sigma factor RsiW